jgi:hypothetical protein
MNRLTIRHNHGVYILRNATIDSGGVVTGVMERGTSTSRLFSATSTKYETPGEQFSYPLYGRRLYESHLSYGVGDDYTNRAWETSPTPGDYEVDVTFF